MLSRRSVEAADRESDMARTNFLSQSQAWLTQTLSALGAFAEGQGHGEEALRLMQDEMLPAAPVYRGCP